MLRRSGSKIFSSKARFITLIGDLREKRVINSENIKISMILGSEINGTGKKQK
jgi:hypothetical protein